MRPAWLPLIALPLLLACVPPASPGGWTKKVDRVSSLKHAVALFENTTAAAVTLVVKGRNLKPKILIIPPMTLYRTLLAPGPYVLIRKETREKSHATFLPGRRYHMELGSSVTAL